MSNMCKSKLNMFNYVFTKNSLICSLHLYLYRLKWHLCCMIYVAKSKNRQQQMKEIKQVYLLIYIKSKISQNHERKKKEKEINWANEILQWKRTQGTTINIIFKKIIKTQSLTMFFNSVSFLNCSFSIVKMLKFNIFIIHLLLFIITHVKHHIISHSEPFSFLHELLRQSDKSLTESILCVTG